MTEDPTDAGGGRKNRKGKQRRVRAGGNMANKLPGPHTSSILQGEAQPHRPCQATGGELALTASGPIRAGGPSPATVTCHCTW